MFSFISSTVKNGSLSNLVINYWISVLLLFSVYANANGEFASFMLAGSGRIIKFQYRYWLGVVDTSKDSC